MDVQEVDRRLREQLEEHVGRPLSDDEWETVKRIQPHDAPAERPEGGTVAWRWTLRGRAAWAAAPAVVLAGVGMFLQWDIAFSLVVRIPLALFSWLLGLAAFGIWVAGIFRRDFRWGDLGGFWGWIVWVSIWWVVPVGLFSIGSALLSHPSRDYWTSAQWLEGNANLGIDTPAEVCGSLLVLAGIALAWVGRPRRAGMRYGVDA